MNSSVYREGRVCYVDPNKIVQANQYGDGSLTENYNIPFDLEDYSIAVDLLVEVPSRMSCFNGHHTHKIEFTTHGDPLSFFGGSDIGGKVGLLTDAPAGVTYNDIVQKDFEGSKESLGITNINISYNSYFYPEVTMNFTDVRGAALMMPNEEIYRLKTRHDSDDQDKIANFFAALFSFPYPTFKLRVKGFYGKMVEYELVVSDFRSRFNNSTGNFESTIKFIGKMYGIYTDIPMAYLMCAPYCRYGSVNNKTIWQQHLDDPSSGFFLDEGIPIPTMLELSTNLLTANRNLTTELTGTNGKEYQRLVKKENLLAQVKKAYNQLFASDNINYIKGGLVITDKITETEKPLFKNLYNYLNEYNNSGYGTSLTYPFNIRTLDELLKNDESRKFTVRIEVASLQTGVSTTDYVATGMKNGIKYGVKCYLSSKNEQVREALGLEDKHTLPQEGYDKNCKYLNKRVRTLIGSLKSDLQKRVDEVITFSSETSLDGKINHDVVEHYLVDFYPLAEMINKDITNTKTALDDCIAQTEEKYEVQLTQLLGFKPSIRNVFKIILAHLQTFVELFMTCCNNVANNPTRGPMFNTDLDIVGNTDLPHDILNDIPPFPLITSQRDNTVVYPSDMLSGVIDEMEFIDSFFDSAFSAINAQRDAENLFSELTDTTAQFLPTNVSDLVYAVNPYKNVFESPQDNVNIDKLFLAFATRAAVHFLCEGKVDYENFAYAEAYNFWRANKYLSPDIIKHFHKNNLRQQFDTFLNNDKNNCEYIDKSPCYAAGEYAKGDTSFYYYKVLPGAYMGYSQFLRDMQENNIKDQCFVAKPGYGPGLGKKKETKCTTVQSTAGASINCYDVVVPSDSVSMPRQYTMFVDNPKQFNKWNDEIETTPVPYLDGKVNEGESAGADDAKKKLISEKVRNVWTSLYSDENTFLFRPVPDAPEKHLVFKKVGLGYRTLPDSVNLRNWKSDSKVVPYSIRYHKDGKSLFMTNNGDFTSGEFIDSFPHNIEGIYENIITKGCACYEIPYYTSLFLGRLLKDGVSAIDPKYTKDALKEKTEAIYAFLSSFNSENDDDFFGLKAQYVKWASSTDLETGFQTFRDYTRIELKHQKAKNSGYDLETLITGLLTIFEPLTTDDKTYNFDLLLTSSAKPYNKINYKEILSEDSNYRGTMNFERALNCLVTGMEAYEKVVRYEDGSVDFVLKHDSQAVKMLDNMTRKQSLFIIPGKPSQSISDFDIKKVSSLIVSSFEVFRKAMVEEYYKDVNVVSTTPQSASDLAVETKLSMYLTLKNLYDRWFADLNIDQWKLNTVNSEFKRFHFIDSFYNDLGDELLVDPALLSSIIMDIYTGGEMERLTSELTTKDFSVYSFMSLLVQRNNMMMLAMPIFNGTLDAIDAPERLGEIFTPHPYNRALNDINYGPSYVCIYPHKPSQHLDLLGSHYPNDGFNFQDVIPDIANTGARSSDVSLKELFRTDEDGNHYIIPAFSVDYGIQNQNIFTEIEVNMDNPQVTEHSIMAQYRIANMKNNDDRSVDFVGQNLYDVYSNHSYTCKVTMMGCSQIQPLMYFQLNNVPLFKGAYQIIRVEHNIVPGNMTTTFTGVRMNKNKIPMVKQGVNVTSILESYGDGVEVRLGAADPSVPTNDVESNTEFTDPGSPVIPPKSKPDKDEYTYDKWVALGKMNRMEYVSSYTEGKTPDEKRKNSFNALNPDLRRLIFGITQNANQAGIGLRITSATRNVKTGKGSDHSITDILTVGDNHARKKIKTTVNGVEYDYTKLGCAIDCSGLNAQGQVDKAATTVNLFRIMALNYGNSIRQLLWEITSDAVPSDNSISNCIHLSSYGEGNNDKREVFVAQTDANGKWGALTATFPNKDKTKCPNNIPRDFLKILLEMFESDNVNTNTMTFNNFTKAGIKLDANILRKWLNV